MSYIALYREWRPSTFSQVVGQEHVVRTLQNALRTQRISHAYLFCGPRGTGKTSMAKILAKAVNCLNSRDGEPCNECVNCQRINAGNSLDVFEIDAASNRGIDEIRDLREKIKLSPVEGRYKVYIIDEVHMLTSEAFNALLKTLEEPPAHIIFILATTEPHKIPLTILSRCQRFDFHRIPVKQIVGRLKEILEFNQLEWEEEALYLIARIATGGLRDALSLLDQCMASGEKRISVELVTAIAGIVSDDFMAQLLDAIKNRDATRCLTMLYEASAQGKDVRQFLADLILYIRNLLLLQLGQGTDDLITVSRESLEKLKRQSASFSREQLLEMIKSLAAVENEIKWSSQGLVLLEVTLLKLIDTISQPRVKREELPKAAVGSKQEVQVERSPQGVSTSKTQGQNISLNLIKDRWQDILAAVRKAKITAYAFFVEAKPVELKGHELVLQYKAEHKFHKERSEQPANRQVMEQVLENLFAVKINVRCVLGADPAETENKKASAEDDIVEKAIEIFGGEIVEVE